MVDYNPHSISQMYEQYSSTHSSKRSNANKTFADSMKAGGGGTNLSGSGSSAMEGLMRSQREQTQKDNDSKPDEDVGSAKSFLENAWSWLSASGGEPEKPKVYDGSSIYSRPEFDPSRYTKPINFSEQDKRIDDMLNNRDDDPDYKDYAGSTYDEVKEQEGVEEYRSTKARAEGINNAIKGIMDTEQRQDDIRNAVNKTIDSLRSADPTVDYVIQAGDTLSSIAAKTGTTVEDLVKVNNIEDKNKIFTGNDLIIPTDKTTKTKEDVVSSLIKGYERNTDDVGGTQVASSGEIRSDAFSGDAITDTMKSLTSQLAEQTTQLKGKTGLGDTTARSYKVTKGDTLSQIARKKGITLSDIKIANPDIDPDRIAIGQEIKIPKNSTIKRIEKADTKQEVINTVSKAMPTVQNPLDYIFKQGIVGLDETNLKHQNTIKGFLNTSVPDFVGDKSEVTSGKKAWCGAFVNHVLENLGVGSLNTNDKYDKLRAKKYLDYGDKVSSIEEAKPGDLIITKGPEGFHVTFFTSKSMDGETINALGGNQSNKVQVSEYSTSDIQGIRRIGDIKDVDTETIKSLTVDIAEGNSTR